MCSGPQDFLSLLSASGQLAGTFLLPLDSELSPAPNLELITTSRWHQITAEWGMSSGQLDSQNSLPASATPIIVLLTLQEKLCLAFHMSELFGSLIQL